MNPCTFIHAADLHLDAQLPLPGLRERALSGRITKLLRDATFMALERLTEACLANNVDFLLLAGDIYNHADSSLRARMALRDSFLRLGKEGISVFLAHGNHDPLNAADGSYFPWPDNVTVFGPEGQSVVARNNGVPKAVIIGISHADGAEARNLARMIAQTGGEETSEALFRIALVHCALSGFSGAHEKYAPCTMADLTQGSMQYWALGHIHMPLCITADGKTVSPSSSGQAFAAFCGSLQGLHINENGPHGCLLGQAGQDGRLTLAALPLCPVQWEKISVEPGEDIMDMPSLENLIVERLAAVAETPAHPQAHAIRSTGFAPELHIARLTITGRTPLNHILRKPGVMEDLFTRIEGELGGMSILLRDIQLHTRPAMDLESIASRSDLAGELLRTAREMAHSPDTLEEFSRSTLASLYDRPKAKAFLQKPDTDDVAALLEEAAFLCLDLLEPEGADSEGAES